MFHHVGGRRHTPVVCNERRQPHTRANCCDKPIIKFERNIPSTRIALSSQDENEGSSHLIECTGKRQNGKGCVAWIPTRLPKKPKGEMNHPFLCDFCAASEVSELREKQSKTLRIPLLLVIFPVSSTLNPTSSIEGEILSEFSA